MHSTIESCWFERHRAYPFSQKKKEKKKEKGRKKQERRRKKKKISGLCTHVTARNFACFVLERISMIMHTVAMRLTTHMAITGPTNTHFRSVLVSTQHREGVLGELADVVMKLSGSRDNASAGGSNAPPHAKSWKRLR